MTKDFNKDLDQTNGDQQRKTAASKGRRSEVKPESDPKAARERAGEGFEDAGDEYAESGAGGAGYREAEPKRSE